jgi:hypothetical protein
MRHSFKAVIVTALLLASAACVSTTTSPSSVAGTSGTITFGGLTTNGASVTTYVESGLTVSAMSGD